MADKTINQLGEVTTLSAISEFVVENTQSNRIKASNVAASLKAMTPKLSEELRCEGEFTVPDDVSNMTVYGIQKGTFYDDNFTSFFLNSDGQVFGTGYNDTKQILATGAQSSPVAMSPSILGVRKIVSKTGCVLALNKDGDLYGWGFGSYGQLGIGLTGSAIDSPTIAIGGHKFVDCFIARNGEASYAIKSDGTLYAFGRNTLGQLGDGTTTNRSSPVAVLGGVKFQKFVAGNGSAYGIDFQGNAYAWGANTNGRLGDGTTDNRSSPVAVIGGHKFRDINTTDGSLYGLRTDGTMYNWGVNFPYGQLGDGTTAHKSSPVAMLGGHTFHDISHRGANIGQATNMHFVKDDGEVWSVGYNGVGDLGDGTIESRSSPVAVAGGLKFVQFVPWGTRLGLTANGQLYQWGQLMDTTANASTPVAVSTSLRFIEIGRRHGITSDGLVYGWGYNTNGEIGDGTTDDRSSPVAILGGFRCPYGFVVSTGVMKAAESETISYRASRVNPYFGAAYLGPCDEIRVDEA